MAEWSGVDGARRVPEHSLPRPATDPHGPPGRVEWRTVRSPVLRRLLAPVLTVVALAGLGVLAGFIAARAPGGAVSGGVSEVASPTQPPPTAAPANLVPRTRGSAAVAADPGARRSGLQVVFTSFGVTKPPASVGAPSALLCAAFSATNRAGTPVLLSSGEFSVSAPDGVVSPVDPDTVSGTVSDRASLAGAVLGAQRSTTGTECFSVAPQAGYYVVSFRDVTDPWQPPVTAGYAARSG